MTSKPTKAQFARERDIPVKLKGTRMLLNILLGLVAVVALLVLVVATRPAAFRIERSTTIAAPPDVAFAQVNDFRAWKGWSPWEKLDPDLKRTYEGPSAGVGSIYSWKGNNQVGEGRMTIQKSEKPALVVINLEFIQPFAATNTATFAFTPVAEGTQVVWTMDGKRNFMMKAFSLLMNMDKLIGGDFERGLAAMKSIAEGGTTARTEAAHAGR